MASSSNADGSDVVQQIDQAITERVQKTLRQLKADCAAIEAVIQAERTADAIKREQNNTRRWNGTVLMASSAMLLLLLVVGLAGRMAASAKGGGRVGDEARAALNVIAGMLLAVVLGCAGGAARLVRHQEPVLAAQQLRRLDEYATALRKVAQQAESLHNDYAASLHEKQA